MPIWKKALSCITRIGRGIIDSKVLLDTLLTDEKASRWLTDNGKDVEKIMEHLFDLGIIGNHDGIRWLFKYKDTDLYWNSEIKLLVHFGLKEMFNL